jgi:hypothetical protein
MGKHAWHVEWLADENSRGDLIDAEPRSFFAALALLGMGLVALGLLLGASARADGGFLDVTRDAAHPFDAQIRDNARTMIS